MLRFASLLSVIALAVALAAAPPPPAHAQAYFLRDTTALPPPTPGAAQLVVTRERHLDQGLKPEFVVVDWAPFGQLPPRSAAIGEITPGWHRVWLGRGSTAQVWFEAVAGERYLLRLREANIDGQWRADLVRESRQNYREFAKSMGMKVAVTTASGLQSIRRNIDRLQKKAEPDSIGRNSARAKAQIPIVVPNVFYMDVLEKDDPPSDYDAHPGTLTLDANALRYTRADTLVLEIPRSAVTVLHYGGIHRQQVNPWLDVHYDVGNGRRGASFVDSTPLRYEGAATYNRLFHELEKTIPNR